MSRSTARFVRAELDVKGSMIYDHPRDFATTIDLIVSGKLKLGKTRHQHVMARRWQAVEP
jgi:threonine dehydrogenase-like Zn-dependent dehydrogenase